MSAPNYTEGGAWRAVPGEYGDGFIVANDIGCVADEISDKEDALVMAAAPELYEALETLLYGASEMEQATTPAGDLIDAVYAVGTLAKARAALAKARGGKHERQAFHCRVFRWCAVGSNRGLLPSAGDVI